ncbi:MAG: signal peptide peptidase SppA [Sedimentisphaerales bacterium]|nr:signal peptide peptidase SppA [Sedimentisphaerales bacterium]
MCKQSCIAVFVTLTLLLPSIGCGPAAFQVQLVSPGRDLVETEVMRDEGFFIGDKIALIDVDGMLSHQPQRNWLRSEDSSVSTFVEKLNKAAADPSVKAVVLRINSPGGTVSASDTMYHHLLDFKFRTGKPVFACIMSLGCSGAYYLACGADGIIAQPSAVTGSIGTIMQTVSFKGTMDLIGIRAVAIKSGELKDIASPFKQLTSEEQKVLSDIIMDFYEQFLEVVQEHRNQLTDSQLRELADGRVFTAFQAKENKLIDRTGYLEDAIVWAKERANLRKVRVVMYHRPSSSITSVYGSAAGPQINPMVNIELPDWLQSGQAQFLYLWQPGVE